jgi:hypothetical protein
LELSCRMSLLKILQREGKSNPALSVLYYAAVLILWGTNIDTS